MLATFSLGVVAQEEDSDVEEVVVTGSKIKSSDLYSFAPVTEITAEDIAVTGKASIGEILLELPSQVLVYPEPIIMVVLVRLGSI